MRFTVPGQDISVRLFERVETVDTQYNIYDIGIEQDDGSIDSVVVGGSFSLIKSLANKAEADKAKKKRKAEKKKARKQADKQVKETTPTVNDVPTLVDTESDTEPAAA